VMDIAVLPIGIVPSILLAKTSTFSGIVIPSPHMNQDHKPWRFVGDLHSHVGPINHGAV
jgi:hypothetical protein